MNKNKTINDVESKVPSKKRNNYNALWAMIFLFGLPYIAAYYFYFNRDDITFVKSNYGNIINPARPVADILLTKLDDSEINLSSFKGKWVLLSIGNSECLADCQENLYKIRQIKKAAGQEHKRIKKVFLLKDVEHIQAFIVLLKDYKNMEVIKPSGEGYNRFLTDFSYKNEDITDAIFIIDPLGNYMMMYPKGADASKILKDMERLLKVSKIG